MENFSPLWLGVAGLTIYFFSTGYALEKTHKLKKSFGYQVFLFLNKFLLSLKWWVVLFCFRAEVSLVFI